MVMALQFAAGGSAARVFEGRCPRPYPRAHRRSAHHLISRLSFATSPHPCVRQERSVPLVNGFKKKNLGATSDDLVAGADESLSVIARCAAIGSRAAVELHTLYLP